MKTNTSPELYDDIIDGQSELKKADILMNEADIFQGLMELGKEKDLEVNYKKIQIIRNGKKKIEFRIRPLSEDEQQSCLKNSTKYGKSKPGQPKVVVDSNRSLFRSYLIYSATVDEDRKKVWDNQKAKQALNILNGVDMIDLVLLAGEKDRIIDDIETISGYQSMEEVEEAAKN